MSKGRRSRGRGTASWQARPIAPILELEELTKRFGTFTAVDSVSLEVASGEVVGLIGANGSGKTTTMRMLLGLIRPSSGRARIGGREVGAVAAREGVGYLPDDPPLDDRWTIRQQLDWWEDLRGPAPRREELETALSVETEKKIGDLSRGNRQKAAITMALMHDPRLVVMDEPATGLDPLVRHDLWDALRGAVDRGAAVFVSSHVLGDIETVSDRVVVLHHGQAIYDGSVADLARTSRRTVTIDFAGAVDRAAFAALDGVEVVVVEGSQVVLSVAGSLDRIVKAAARFEVVDFTSSGASLEGGFVDLSTSVGS